MPIKITRIEVDALGPLSSFRQDLTDVTLIYGHNEKGKTFLVEFLLRSLFRNLTAFPKDEFRISKPKGKVFVAGIEKGLVTFSPASTVKLESKWEGNGRVMPPNIARLLVVKGGDLDISRGTGDTISLDAIREFLSSQAMLGSIQKKIRLKGTRDARIAGGQILGANSGDIAKRKGLQEEVESISNLVERVDRELADGDVIALNGQIAAASNRAQGFEAAKKYAAFQLSQKKQEIQKDLHRFEDAGLDATQSNYDELLRNQKTLERKLSEKERGAEKGKHYPWLNNALQEYQRYSSQDLVPMSHTLLILALVSFLSALALIAAGHTLPSIVAIFGGIALGLWHIQRLKQSQGNQIELKELEKIRATYQEKFGESCKDLPTMRVKLEEIAGDYHARQQIDRDIKTTQEEINRVESEVRRGLEVLGHADVPSALWGGTLTELRDALRGAERNLEDLEKDLARYDIDSSDYVQENPGLVYERAGYEKAKTDKQRLEGDLRGLEQSLLSLKSEIHGVLGQHSLTDWGDLILKLRDLKREKLEVYKQTTAELIAGKLLNQVIESNLERDNEEILDNLDSDTVKDPISEITKQYVGLEIENETIVAIDQYNQRLPFRDLSTGTREQILLALRLGFAAKVMQGDTAFLILDDAFQHSDWDRRPRLVDAVLKLAKKGWQIIYFAMDDNIRDLFDLKAKKVLKRRYARIDL